MYYLTQECVQFNNSIFCHNPIWPKKLIICFSGNIFNPTQQTFYYISPIYININNLYIVR